MNHNGNANKMVETPRTDAAEKHAYQFKDDYTPVCESKFVRQLERELNAANERIKRLEEVGDEVVINYVNSLSAFEMWRKAKEVKP